jgi:hypothetical protein
MWTSVSRLASRWNIQHVALLPPAASPHQRPLVVVCPALLSGLSIRTFNPRLAHIHKEYCPPIADGVEDALVPPIVTVQRCPISYEEL